MPNKTISDLDEELLAADVAANDDLMEIDDVSAGVTKKITPASVVAGGGALTRNNQVSAALGTIAVSNDTDDTPLLTLSRNPASAQAGELIKGTMGSLAEGPAIDVSSSNAANPIARLAITALGRTAPALELEDTTGSGTGQRLLTLAAVTGTPGLEIGARKITKVRDSSDPLTIEGASGALGQPGLGVRVQAGSGGAGDGVTPGEDSGALELFGGDAGADGGAGAGIALGVTVRGARTGSGPISIGETQTSTTMVGASIGVGLVAPTVSVLGDAFGAVINDQIDLTAQRAGADAIVLAATEATGTITAKIDGLDVVQVRARGIDVTGRSKPSRGVLLPPLTAVQPANYTIALEDRVVRIDSTLGSFTLTLPDVNAVALEAGWHCWIKDVGGALGTNFVSLARANAGEAIEGVESNYALGANFGSWHVWFDGADWWLL